MARDIFNRVTGNPSTTISAAPSSRRPRRSRRPQRPNRSGGGSLTEDTGEGGGEEKAPFTDRPYNPLEMAGTGSATGMYVDPNQSYGTGSDWLDTPGGSKAFNNLEAQPNAIRGLLGQAGVDFSSGGIGGGGAMGGGQAGWLNQQVQDLGDQYNDLQMVQNDAGGGLTFENFMYGAFGNDVPDSISGNNAAAATGPGPVTINPNAGQGVQINPNAGASGDISAFLQAQGINNRQWRDMRPDRRERLRSQFAASQTAQTPVVPAGNPGTEQWRNEVYYPTVLSSLRRRWEHAMPSDRGTESTRWTGANSTVAY